MRSSSAVESESSVLLALHMMSLLEEQSDKILHISIVSFQLEKLGNLGCREPVVLELLDMRNCGKGTETAGVA